jgi:hypothetical protein
MYDYLHWLSQAPSPHTHIAITGPGVTGRVSGRSRWEKKLGIEAILAALAAGVIIIIIIIMLAAWHAYC